MGGAVSGNYGLEKFSHLEDKIYRTIEQIKRERQQRESLEHDLANLRGQVDKLRGDKERLESQLQRLLGERHKIKHKVEGMLDTIARIDPEAEAAKG
jgi:chromosome segregation ATPase